MNIQRIIHLKKHTSRYISKYLETFEKVLMIMNKTPQKLLLYVGYAGLIILSMIVLIGFFNYIRTS